MELVEQAPEGVIGVGSRVRVSPKLEWLFHSDAEDATDWLKSNKITPESVGVVREVRARSMRALTCSAQSLRHRAVFASAFVL
jgi:hypothetical protein